MIHEYSRTELLVEKEGLQRLKDATVMVLGVGGVGSHCIEALARSGVGRLILVDNDKVTLTNINRQSIAYHSTIGQYKTKLNLTTSPIEKSGVPKLHLSLSLNVRREEECRTNQEEKAAQDFIIFMSEE